MSEVDASEVRLKLDKAKMLNLGGGSISGFCRRYNMNRQLMSNLFRGKSHVKEGTKTQKMVDTLIDLGAATWENVKRGEKDADAGI